MSVGEITHQKDLLPMKYLLPMKVKLYHRNTSLRVLFLKNSMVLITHCKK